MKCENILVSEKYKKKREQEKKNRKDNFDKLPYVGKRGIEYKERNK